MVHKKLIFWHLYYIGYDKT